MEPRLLVKEKALLLDLGRPRRLYTHEGPVLARYLLVGRLSPMGLLRLGLGPGGVYRLPLALDPLDFAYEDGVLRLPGFAFYPAPPPFVETPYYAWLED
ncbi:hypothetical protein [Thermus filiformis]|jgi:hypothetical protein|uniref:Uncharacterized protein n=1 Tax=Thermus filiformis TaxID=276 RepID=A0A0D6XCH3_THEFI|nr:hypothetical protein [Thermus filiformis]KIX84568.1 hypothetical protein THFILI_08325 [Thermus filiformis]